MDQVIERIAVAMDAVGMRGSRLRWKWNQRQRSIGEQKAALDMATRSIKGRHKMCPSCRALIPKRASKCPECGESTRSVRGPGAGRAIGGIFPGGVNATALVLLANGFWFALLAMRLLSHYPEAGIGSLLFFPGEFSRSLGQFGMLNTSMVQGIGDLWRLIPPIFLHGGLLHFFFNSYILLQVGPFLEEEYGRERFWIIYLASGAGGFLLKVIWSNFTMHGYTLGASGAVLGVMGALIAYGIRRGGSVGDRVKRSMLQYVAFIFLISLLMGGRVDHLAHAGGLVTGFILAWVIPWGPIRNKQTKAAWDLVAILCILAVLFAFYKISLSLL
jgi:rhomboid protease GluP